MQSTFVNITRHLQLCSAELLGYGIVIKANSMLSDGFAAFTTGLQTLFLLVEHGKSSILCLF